MPRKIIPKPSTRLNDDIKNAEPGDYCYYLNTSNKPMLAEIKKVTTENDIIVLHVVGQAEYKFMFLPYYFCSFNEKDLKGKKRANCKKDL